MTNCKVGYLNLRGSSIADLVFEDSTVDELDLAESEFTRASFPGSHIGHLTLRAPGYSTWTSVVRGSAR